MYSTLYECNHFLIYTCHISEIICGSSWYIGDFTMGGSYFCENFTRVEWGVDLPMVKTINKPQYDINYVDSNRKMYKKDLKLWTLQMDKAIVEFMKFLSTLPIVTWICAGQGLLSNLTWPPSFALLTNEWVILSV